MDIVANLFAFISKDLVFALFDVAADQVTKKPMEFDAGVVGAGEASAAKATGWHIEIPAVLLHHDIACDFRGAEDGVLRLIDGKGFGYAVFVGRIVVVPTAFELAQANRVRQISVDLVRGHVDKRRFRTGAASGFEQIQGPDGVGVEIVKRNRGRAIVRWLGSGMDNRIWLNFGHEVQNALPVADVEIVMRVVGDVRSEAVQRPTGIAFRSEKDRPLVVVDAEDAEAVSREVQANFRADQPARAGDEGFFIQRTV